ncbi:MAG TPA: AraC family transcriptional regulator [Clostridiaceae bacterium]|nr:AraC family transcriptional regulator [Clostridiaceae bacterium]
MNMNSNVNTNIKNIKNIFKQDLSLPNEFEFEILFVDAAGRSNSYELNNLHFHDVMEIDVITDGEGLMFFDHNVYHIQAGDVYIVNAFENHSTYSNGTLKLVCIHFNPYTLTVNVFTDSEYAEILNNGIPLFCNLIRNDDENANNIKTILQKIICEWTEAKEGYRPMIRLLLGELLLYLNRNYKKDVSTENNNYIITSSYQRIREVLDYIHSNFQHQLTLDKLSQKALMHKTYFSAFFKKATGYTVTEYITNLRINTACNLLKSSSLTVKEISAMCGFNTVSNFNKAFKKALAQKPQEYRRNNL